MMAETKAASILEIAALQFTKDWTDPADFPTYEPNETQVRADMQYLFNEIKNWLNDTMIPAVQKAATTGSINGSYVEDVYISANGHLIVVMQDGSEVDLGKYAGGANEAYVVSLRMTEDGHLIVTMSDDSEVDLGEITAQVPDTIINQTVITENLYAERGDIAELTVDSLSTSRRVIRYLAGDTSDDNYIHAEDQFLRFMTAKTDGSTTQHTDRYGRLLYWEKDISGAYLNELGYPEVDGEQVPITTEWTEWPVVVYDYDEGCALEWAFRNVPFDDTEYYIPMAIFGQGDTSGNVKGYFYKLKDTLRFEFTQTGGNLLTIELSNAGIRISGAGDTAGLRNIVTVSASAFDETATYGSVGDIVAVIED